LNIKEHSLEICLRKKRKEKISFTFIPLSNHQTIYDDQQRKRMISQHIELMVSPVKVLFEDEDLSHSKQNSISIENINIETIDGVNNNHGDDDQISPLSVEMTTPTSIQEATTLSGDAATAPV
jgi:hypothetical protein